MTADPNAWRQGQVANTTGKRTPLAVSFDTAAAKLIKRAIDARGGWVQVLVPSPRHERDELDDGGLTYHERSFLQACYYHRLIYLHGPYVDGVQTANPDRRYALKRRWGELVTQGVERPLRGRVLHVRVVRVGEASVHAWDHGHTS